MKQDSYYLVSWGVGRGWARSGSVVSILTAGCLFVFAGCTAGNLRQPLRYEQGLVIILPGIEGQSPLNANIARGLAQGGVPSAIEINDWTVAWSATWLLNLADESRNRRH